MELFDLQGHALLPGFIDAHSHFMAVAHSLLQADLTGAQGEQEMALRIQRHIAAQ